ncbi:MAG: Ig-like domain-containing protein [Gemmatimonadetes bacterium]|nr:Ig-like domain-containing protein [Gemmatimonadota bacterium]
MAGFLALGFVASCSHDRVLAAGRNYRVRVVDGDAQSAPAGSLLERGLTVEVLDAANLPVKAAVIVFRVEGRAADGATIVDSIAVTDVHGRAAAQLRLGATPGAVRVVAFPQGALDRGVTFTAAATVGASISGLLPLQVGPGDTLSIAGTALGGLTSAVEIGSTRVHPVSGSDGLLRVVVPDCLADGDLAVRVLSGTAWTSPRTVRYASRSRVLTLRPYEATVISAAALGTCVTLSTEGGAEYMLIPQLAVQGTSTAAIVVRITAGGAATASLFAGQPARATGLLSAQAELDARLRDEERRLAPHLQDIEQYSESMPALAVGTRRTFNVIKTLDGTQFAPAVGQLRWVGEHLGIYVDTVAAAAYSDVELGQLGRLFDRELYGTVTETFGPESDIDKNGRVLVFLTPRVNALVRTEDCGQRGFVTGFFFGRDLLPSLPNSNAGEVFYAMVPDSAAAYSCAHSLAEAKRLVSSTFIHEMQHMISFFHHVVARGGEAEERWLNEGLSHIAEEMASKLYEARFPPPTGRSTPEQIFPDSAQPFITPQLLNSYVYLFTTPNHSVTTVEGSGSLEERGAAWLFLRWLGDQKGEAIYRQLVQTSQRGIANVEARAGEPFGSLFGDFSIALWADSLPGVPRASIAPRHRFVSRNLRQLMARQALIAGWLDPFPIKPVRVPVGGYAEGSIMPGTMVFGSLGPFSPSQPPVLLGYARQDGSAFGAGDGAQMAILRVK